MKRELHMKNIKRTGIQYGALAIIAMAVVGTPVAYAVTSTTTSKLSQQINNGVISTDFRTAANAVVPSPTFAMTAVSVSTSLQTATGTYGLDAQRATVDNPGGANNGWTLAINATTPATDLWTTGGGSPVTYDYKGATAALGQLSVDPTLATITAVTGGSTGVTKGSVGTFTTVSPITIMQADAGSADIWNGYITGVGLSQTIPANKPAGTYTLNMTQTLTSL